MIRIAATALLAATLTGPLHAREQASPEESAPIIAGQPDIRVSPSGDVIAPVDAYARRDENGKVRVRHQDVPPPDDSTR